MTWAICRLCGMLLLVLQLSIWQCIRIYHHVYVIMMDRGNLGSSGNSLDTAKLSMFFISEVKGKLHSSLPLFTGECHKCSPGHLRLCADALVLMLLQSAITMLKTILKTHKCYRCTDPNGCTCTLLPTVTSQSATLAHADYPNTHPPSFSSA